MEFEHDPGPMLGMCGCDAELFERVWQRVGVGERPDCPVEAVGAGADAPETMPMQLPEEADMAAEEAAATEEPTPMQPTQQPAPAAKEQRDDFPGEDDLPCLGSGSAGHAGPLQQYIRQELEGWQFYRHLARRINGPNARTLAALASDKHRCARKLAAAHFLIAGVRYWPTDRLDTPRLNAWLGALRSRFAAEQRAEHRYRAAACDTADPCLKQLFLEMAAACGDHGAVIREVLESAL